MSHQLVDYLRVYRKRSGLSQSEVAFLLGGKDGSQLSRYEKHHRMPPLHVALALEAIFGAPAAELFAGLYESVMSGVSKRIEKFGRELRKQAAQGVNLKKLHWLEEHDSIAAEERHTASCTE